MRAAPAFALGRDRYAARPTKLWVQATCCDYIMTVKTDKRAALAWTLGLEPVEAHPSSRGCLPHCVWYPIWSRPIGQK